MNLPCFAIIFISFITIYVPAFLHVAKTGAASLFVSAFVFLGFYGLTLSKTSFEVFSLQKVSPACFNLSSGK